MLDQRDDGDEERAELSLEGTNSIVAPLCSDQMHTLCIQAVSSAVPMTELQGLSCNSLSANPLARRHFPATFFTTTDVKPFEAGMFFGIRIELLSHNFVFPSCAFRNTLPIDCHPPCTLWPHLYPSYMPRTLSTRTLY